MESIVKKNNYIVVQGWMLTDLKLKGNELLIYAIIYGFSQIEGSCYSGSLNYLAQWTNTSKQNVLNQLKNLINKGYIIKKEIYKNNVKFCEYSCNIENNESQNTTLTVVKNFDGGGQKFLTGVVKNFDGGGQKFLPNNIEDNIDNKLDNNLLEKNQNFSKKEEKKKDPYMIPPIERVFKKEYQKVFNNSVYLTLTQKNRLVELNAEFEDFAETIPIVLQRLKKINFKSIGFKPMANWLLKDNNYTSVLNGEYENPEQTENDKINNILENLKQQG